MGNRAVITAADNSESGNVGIYLHWNGGPESVLAFLEVAKKRGYRDPISDPDYGMARLIGIIHEFIPGELSLGVGVVKEMDCDNWDNGAYQVGKGWEIVSRFGKGHNTVKTVEQLSDGDREQFSRIVEKLSNK